MDCPSSLSSARARAGVLCAPAPARPIPSGLSSARRVRLLRPAPAAPPAPLSRRGVCGPLRAAQPWDPAPAYTSDATYQPARVEPAPVASKPLPWTLGRVRALLRPLSDRDSNNRYLALCLTQLLCSVATFIHDSYLPIYVKDVLGMSNAKLGQCMAAAMVLCQFTKGVSGVVGDVIGSQLKVLRAGLVLSCIAKPCYALSGAVGALWGSPAALGWLTLVKVTDRISKGIREAPTKTLVQKLAAQSGDPPDAAFSLRLALATAGAITGSAIAGATFMLTGHNYIATFAAAAIPVAAAYIWLDVRFSDWDENAAPAAARHAADDNDDSDANNDSSSTHHTRAAAPSGSDTQVTASPSASGMIAAHTHAATVPAHILVHPADSSVDQPPSPTLREPVPLSHGLEAHTSTSSTATSMAAPLAADPLASTLLSAAASPRHAHAGVDGAPPSTSSSRNASPERGRGSSMCMVGGPEGYTSPHEHAALRRPRSKSPDVIDRRMRGLLLGIEKRRGRGPGVAAADGGRDHDRMVIGLAVGSSADQSHTDHSARSDASAPEHAHSWAEDEARDERDAAGPGTAAAAAATGIEHGGGEGGDGKSGAQRWQSFMKLIRSFPPGYWQSLAVVAMLYVGRFDFSFVTIRARAVLPPALLPTLAMIVTGTTSCVALLTGVAARKTSALRRNRLLLIGISMMAIADLCYSLPMFANPTGMVMGAVATGMHMGLTQGLVLALLGTHFPASCTGTAWSLTDTLLGFALAGANLLAGTLADVTEAVGAGSVGCFAGGAIAACCAAILLLVFERWGALGQEREEEECVLPTA